MKIAEKTAYHSGVGVHIAEYSVLDRFFKSQIWNNLTLKSTSFSRIVKGIIFRTEFPNGFSQTELLL